MANRKKRRRRNPRRRHRVHHRRRRNPFSAAPARNLRRQRFFRRRRRNPVLGNITALAKQAGWAIAGGVLTRSLPEMILREQNVGVTGYIANAAALVGLSWAGTRFFGQEAGGAIAIGGAVMIAGRLVEEFVGQKLVAFGTLPGMKGYLGSDLRYDLSGEFVAQSFPVPYSSLPAVTEAGTLPSPQVAAAAATATPAMSGPWAGSSPWN